MLILNDSQIEAKKELNAFLKNGNQLAITLSGFAGTGKTTLVADFLKNKSRFALTAPTHKAVKVLSQKAGVGGCTIHSLLGLKPNLDIENFDINNLLFYAGKIPDINKYDFIVIDEASMINEHLYNLIIKQATLYRVKIIFVGDEKQLPPVKENVSKVFSEIKTVRLSKIERTDVDNPLISLFNDVRENIEMRGFSIKSKYPDNLTGDKGFVFYDDQNVFIDEAVNHFSDNKVIAWTNREVQFYNQTIRKLITKNAESPFVVGDILMSYNTNNVLTNSEEYVVIEVTYDKKDFLNGWSLKVADSLGSNHSIFVLDQSCKKSLDLFRNTINKLLQTAIQERGSAWPIFYKYRNKVNIMQDINNTDGTLLLKKDLDYAYAITAHKSQGSTYKNVSIVLSDMMCNSNFIDRNKLIYVALTRASHKAMILR